jgi:hypothetical protein
MQDAKDETTSVRVPEELTESIGMLRSATGRDDYDIVTSALRTYLAEERQRNAVAAHYYVIPTGYPSAFVVTARASLRSAQSVFGPEARRQAEVTFGQIDRYAPTRLWWSSDGRSVVVDLAVSGQESGQAGSTASKMVRNRIVDELGLAADDDLEVEVMTTYNMHCA